MHFINHLYIWNDSYRRERSSILSFQCVPVHKNNVGTKCIVGRAKKARRETKPREKSMLNLLIGKRKTQDKATKPRQQRRDPARRKVAFCHTTSALASTLYLAINDQMMIVIPFGCWYNNAIWTCRRICGCRIPQAE